MYKSNDEGEKKAKEIEAETKQLIAAIDRETAELDAKKTVMLGRAESAAKQMSFVVGLATACTETRSR